MGKIARLQRHSIIHFQRTPVDPNLFRVHTGDRLVVNTLLLRELMYPDYKIHVDDCFDHISSMC